MAQITLNSWRSKLTRSRMAQISPREICIGRKDDVESSPLNSTTCFQNGTLEMFAMSTWEI